MNLLLRNHLCGLRLQCAPLHGDHRLDVEFEDEDGDGVHDGLEDDAGLLLQLLLGL